MISQYFINILVGFSLIIFCGEILRRGSVPEKFAFLWLSVSIFALAISIFPGIARKMSDIFSIKTPSNFIFFFAILFLAIVNMLTVFELGKLNLQVQTLAEEIARKSVRVQAEEELN
jgi:hypothetical protein